MKLNLIPVREWGVFPDSRPMVIAGPCSAESLEQTLETAAGVAAAGVRVFRAGIWKPRTHPGCFEGIGTVGLPWMQEARERFGLKVCTEVARADHVAACAKHGIDMVWIGARTTANPFLMQEIAEALGKTDLPVLVKNPISPDLDLWIGALERLNAAGVKKLGVIHRGFSSLQKTPYRNNPGWRIAIELRTLFPDLPFLTDPSHMGGDRRFLPELSQRALDLGVDGLMIETHCHPEKALSDADQQLTPEALRTLLAETLVVRNTDDRILDNQESIRLLRDRIDLIDEDIVSLLRARMAISEEIGQFKKAHNIAILQTRRWDSLMDNMIHKGEEDGLDARFLRNLFNAIHEESVRIQNDILSEKPGNAQKDATE